MMTPETLAAALRVTQHGGRTAMAAARRHSNDDQDNQETPRDDVGQSPSPTERLQKDEPA